MSAEPPEDAIPRFAEAWNAWVKAGEATAKEICAALREVDFLPLPGVPTGVLDDDLNAIAGMLLQEVGFAFGRTRLADGTLLFVERPSQGRLKLVSRAYHAKDKCRVTFLARNVLPTTILAVLPAPFTKLLVELSAALHSFGPRVESVATLETAGWAWFCDSGHITNYGVTNICADAHVNRGYSGGLSTTYSLSVCTGVGTRRLEPRTSWLVADPALRPTLDRAVAACRAHHAKLARTLTKKIAAWEGLFEKHGFLKYRVLLRL